MVAAMSSTFPRKRLVFDPLTKTQSPYLREIGQRITRAIDPDDPRPADRPPPAATHTPALQ